jgi:hypothetical protein
MHGITDSVPESIERLHDRSRNRFSGMSVKQLSPPSFGDVDDLHRRPSTQLWKQQHHRGSGLQTVNVWGFASLNECIVFNYVPRSHTILWPTHLLATLHVRYSRSDRTLQNQPSQCSQLYPNLAQIAFSEAPSVFPS